MEKISVEAVENFLGAIQDDEYNEVALYLQFADEPMCVSIKKHLSMADMLHITNAAVSATYTLDDDGKCEYMPCLRDFSFDAQLVSTLTNIDIDNMSPEGAWKLVCNTDLLALIGRAVGTDSIQQCRAAYRRELEEFQRKINVDRNDEVRRIIKQGDEQQQMLGNLLATMQTFIGSAQENGLDLKTILNAANGITSIDEESLVTNILEYQNKHKTE